MDRALEQEGPLSQKRLSGKDSGEACRKYVGTMLVLGAVVKKKSNENCEPGLVTGEKSRFRSPLRARGGQTPPVVASSVTWGEPRGNCVLLL